jgi:hypothetical protein
VYQQLIEIADGSNRVNPEPHIRHVLPGHFHNVQRAPLDDAADPVFAGKCAPVRGDSLQILFDISLLHEEVYVTQVEVAVG